jgi:hypothetical protein
MHVHQDEVGLVDLDREERVRSGLGGRRYAVPKTQQRGPYVAGDERVALDDEDRSWRSRIA